jgi:hypothetical protein
MADLGAKAPVAFSNALPQSISGRVAPVDQARQKYSALWRHQGEWRFKKRHLNEHPAAQHAMVA